MLNKNFVRVYNYTDCPTIRKFSLSNKRIRFIQGPFGSGKSSGMVAEVVRRGHEQAPSPQDGIRRIRVAVVRNCYDDETELLTNNGWKLFRDVNHDDLIASLVNDKLTYNRHDGISIFPYNGKMICFDSEGVNFCVTPDHKMYVSKKTIKDGIKFWNNFEVKTAQEIYKTQMYRVKRDAIWESDGVCMSLAFMEWFGFWMAEGSAAIYTHDGYEKPRCVITQKNNKDYVRKLFIEAGIPFTENTRADGSINYRVNVNNYTKDLIIQLSQLGKSYSKSIPTWMRQCNTSQIKSFIKGYLAGDGSHRKDGCIRATTASKKLADDIQELALKADMVVNISISDRTGRELEINGIKTQVNHPTYILTFLNKKKFYPNLHVNKTQTNHLRGWYEKEYNGNVYCVQMPLIPVYVRRNGKAFWCMRTYRQLEDSTIRTVHYWLPPAKYGTWNKTDHNYLITAFPGVEIELNFRALDRPDQVDNLLSVEYTFAWFNEYREIPWAVFEAMDGRIGRYPSVEEGGCTWIGIIGDTNPPDEHSPYYKFFEGPYPNLYAKERPDNAQIWKQPSGLSPQAENTRNLARNYYQNLSKNKTQAFVNVYVHGLYGYLEEGKPVYANSYNDNIHVSRNPIEVIKGLPIISGWDFGLNPSVVLGQITPIGRVHVLKALTSDGMGLEKFLATIVIPMIRMEFFGHKIIGYGDPAGNARGQTDEKTCYDIFRNNGFYDIEPAYTNDLIPRIGAAEKLFSRLIGGVPGVIIDPACSVLRKAASSGYRYKKMQNSVEETYSDIPEKNFYSHIMNAFEYMCMFVGDAADRSSREAAFLKQIEAMPMHSIGSAVAGY